MKFHVKMIIACIAIAVLLCLAFVLYHNPNKTQKPYQHLDSKEVESIRVMWGELVIHDMSESEITEFVTILNCVTHSGKAKNYELSVGSDLNKVFVLVYSDGKTESISAESIWGKESGYLFINQKPYNSASEEIRLIDQKWSEYYQNYYYSQQQKVGS